MGYDAFLSYSHAADGRLAPQVQVGLQRFAKPWWRRRALRVFRDETGLAASPHLWAGIEEALAASEWFVFLASPEAAHSEWVERELEWWLANRSAGRVLPVVTDGELVWDRAADRVDGAASTAVPAILAEVWGDEPRWVDLRWARSAGDLDLRDARFRDAIADIAAPLHGIAKDELESEEVRQHRRTVRTAVGGASGMALLAAAALVAGAFAVGQRNEARAQRAEAQDQERAALEQERSAADRARVAQARAVAAQAVANAPVRVDRALLLGAHALELSDEVMTHRELLAVVDSAAGLEGFRPELAGTMTFDVTADGLSLVGLGADGWLRRWTTADWRLVAETSVADLGDPYALELVDDDRAVVVYGEDRSVLHSIEDLEPLGALRTASDGVLAAVAPDGSWFVSGPVREGPDAERIVVSDLATGRVVERLDPGCDGNGVAGVLPGPRDLLVVTCRFAGLSRLTDRRGASSRDLDLGFDVASGWFDPEGSKLVLSDHAGRLLVLRTSDGSVLGDDRLGGGAVRSAAFDPTGRFLAVGGGDGTVAVWDTGVDGATFDLLHRLTGFERAVQGVGFLGPPDGSGGSPSVVAAPRLLVSAGEVVSEWDPGRPSLLSGRVDEVEAVPGVAPVFDEERGLAYLVSDDERTVLSVSLRDGAVLDLFEATAPVLALLLGADGERILSSAGVDVAVSGLPEVRIEVRSTTNGSLELALEPDGWGVPLGWSPDGVSVVFVPPGRPCSASYEVGELRSGTLTGASMPSGCSFVLGQPADRVDTGPIGFDPASTADLVRPPALWWSLSGGIVDIGKDRGVVRFLDGDALWRGSLRLTPGFTLTDVAPGRSGELLITSSTGSVWRIDPERQETVGDPYLRENALLREAAISPDGSIVASLDDRGVLHLWDGPTGLPLTLGLAAGEPGATPVEVLFLTDGTLVSVVQRPSGGIDAGTARLEFRWWRLDAASLAETACRLAGRELTAEEWRMFVDPEGTPEPVCG